MLRRHLLSWPLIAATAALPFPTRAADTKPAANWQIQITQLDKSGSAIGKKLPPVTCPQNGCETFLNLQILDKTRVFFAAFTFVRNGAYIGLKATGPDIGRVIEFEKGFDGPVFMPLFGPGRDSATVQYILTGTGIPAGTENKPALMENHQSLVFQRKLEPDLTLKLDFTRPPAGGGQKLREGRPGALPPHPRQGRALDVEDVREAV